MVAVGDKITTVAALQELECDTIVNTGLHRREKTHSNDEWDLVMSGEEVLAEGRGSVTVVYVPEG